VFKEPGETVALCWRYFSGSATLGSSRVARRGGAPVAQLIRNLLDGKCGHAIDLD